MPDFTVFLDLAKPVHGYVVCLLKEVGSVWIEVTGVNLNGFYFVRRKEVEDAVDFREAVGEGWGDFFELLPGGGALDHDRVTICAFVALDADGFYGESVCGEVVWGEELVDLGVQVLVVFGPVCCGRAEYADGEAGAGKRVAPDHLLGEAQAGADFSDFIFVEIREGFNDAATADQFFNFRDAVVVGFDFVCALGTAGFDCVRVDCTLAE